MTPDIGLLWGSLSQNIQPQSRRAWNENMQGEEKYMSSVCLYDQQDATYIMIFIINNALHVSGLCRPSSGAYKLQEQPMVMACCS